MRNSSPHIKNILIAGASGYIGRSLIPRLRQDHPEATITALSRSPRESQDPQVIWKTADLFSLKDLETAAPEQFEIAYYLVHSMSPTAALDQGNFNDYDLLLADNFSRLVRRQKHCHLLYLSGLIPEEHELSAHLESRQEVEHVFQDHHQMLTIFRAGLIVGPQGSSFIILTRLVDRLPVLICPKWMDHLTTPVDLDRVIQSLSEVAGQPEHYRKTWDLAGCRSLSYTHMLLETAIWRNKHRKLFRVSWISGFLARRWVSFVTGQSSTLVYPLIDSLHHNMLPRPECTYKGVPNRTYAEMLKDFPASEKEKSVAVDYIPEKRQVRSVQRLPLPKNMNAKSIEKEYVRWLPQFMRPFILIDTTKSRVQFQFLSRRIVLLELIYSQERSTHDRQLFYITGGLLVGGKKKGRLEFREVLKKRWVIAAIHSYQPSLPWYIYQQTQARVHLFVMRAFGRHLKRLDSSQP